ncbi:hypothetical protein JTB14_027085 [Gonioctena quinquepunctata]|nr:hypothetical protein JTB14_027085 [Gonioctena quinquepunctata]
MKKGIYVLLYMLGWVYSEEIYQNSSHICEICKCSDKDKFVIDCSDQKFQHILANWPPHNKSLVARFSSNNMTTLEILPMSNQTAELIFDHCNIKYLDPGLFANIRNVELIDLSYNLLTTEEIDGHDFKGPYKNSKFHPLSLKYLNLAYNQIHSLPMNFFENMPDLEELNLEGNDFSVLDPHTQTAIATLSNLKILNLANNQLTELERDAVENLTNLIEINLSSNRLDFVPDNLNHLSKSLRVLKLDHNFIFELNDKSFLGKSYPEDGRRGNGRVQHRYRVSENSSSEREEANKDPQEMRDRQPVAAVTLEKDVSCFLGNNPSDTCTTCPPLEPQLVSRWTNYLSLGLDKETR